MRSYGEEGGGLAGEGRESVEGVGDPVTEGCEYSEEVEGIADVCVELT